MNLLYHMAMGILLYGLLVLTTPLAWMGIYRPSLWIGFWMIYHNEREEAILDDQEKR